jgi:hypothetical protein
VTLYLFDHPGGAAEWAVADAVQVFGGKLRTTLGALRKEGLITPASIWTQHVAQPGRVASRFHAWGWRLTTNGWLKITRAVQDVEGRAAEA